MEDIKKIQEFFSKPLEEGKQLDKSDFAKVVKAVEQTGHPVTVLLIPKFNEIEVITGMETPDNILRDLSNAVDSLGYGRDDIIIAGDSSNLSRREYSDIFRVNGGHKDYFEESVNEQADHVAPMVVKAYKDYIKAKKDSAADVDFAEDPAKAYRYYSKKLNNTYSTKADRDAIEAILKKKYGSALEESVNEDNSYVRVSKPRFIKDKNNPNFLYVNFKYHTGGGVLKALGKETMSGQIRRLSSAEAMKQATALAKDLEAQYNLEDIDVYDKGNGLVQIFAVSDDFGGLDSDDLNRFYSVNEMDMNDPVLVRMRAAKNKPTPKPTINPEYASVKNAKKIAFLKKERAQLMRDMEQEAEPEGGPIANEYGAKLNRIDAAIAKLSGQGELGPERDTDITAQEIARRAAMIGLEENNDQAIAENKILKQAKLSSAEYQKAKKLKGFNKDDYKWNSDESLYIKLNESVPENSTSNLMSTLMSSGKLIEPAGGASMNGKYYQLQGGSEWDRIHFDYDAKSKKPFGVAQIAGHHMPSNLLKRLGFRETRSWTAGVEVYIFDGNYSPNYISEKDMAQLVDEWGKGVSSYAKAMRDFYRDRGRTPGTIDENAFKVGQKVTYLGHPAVVTATKEYNGRDFVSVSYDKGTGKTSAPMILVKSGDVKPINEQVEDPIDTITMDVPLFIRVLEYAREDAQTDMDLHDFTEKAISATKQQGILQMDDYDMLVGDLDQISMEEEEEGYSKFLKTDDNPKGKTKGLDSKTMNKILLRIAQGIEEGKPGLWANIHAKRERGEKPSHGNSKDFKSAVKAGKKINKEK